MIGIAIQTSTAKQALKVTPRREEILTTTLDVVTALDWARGFDPARNSNLRLINDAIIAVDAACIAAGVFEGPSADWNLAATPNDQDQRADSQPLSDAWRTIGLSTGEHRARFRTAFVVAIAMNTKRFEAYGLELFTTIATIAPIWGSFALAHRGTLVGKLTDAELFEVAHNMLEQNLPDFEAMLIRAGVGSIH